MKPEQAEHRQLEGESLVEAARERNAMTDEQLLREALRALKRTHGNAGFGVDCADKRDFMRAIGALRTIEAETFSTITKLEQRLLRE